METRDELDQKMAKIIARMSVISDAAAQRFGGVVHGGQPNNQPKGPRIGMADYHREAWRRARTPVQRAETFQAAKAALANARYAPRRTDTPGTLEWRLAIANAPQDAETVAQNFGISLAHVYNMRKISSKQHRRAA